jgi:hypothetical protein
MLVNDDVDILTEIFTKNRQPMQEVTEEDLFSHIFIIYTFPIVYVTFLLPFPVVKFSLFHD